MKIKHLIIFLLFFVSAEVITAPTKNNKKSKKTTRKKSQTRPMQRGKYGKKAFGSGARKSVSSAPAVVTTKTILSTQSIPIKKTEITFPDSKNKKNNNNKRRYYKD